jgi:hypothetical protein
MWLVVSAHVTATALPGLLTVLGVNCWDALTCDVFAGVAVDADADALDELMATWLCVCPEADEDGPLAL